MSRTLAPVLVLVVSALPGAPPCRAADADFSRRMEQQCARYLDEIEATVKPLSPSRVEATIDRPALAKQLRAMAVLDQEVRDAWIANPSDAAAATAMQRVDAENLVNLRHMLRQNGFPRRAMVGTEGVQDAWLLVQHADDLELQKDVLAQLKPRLRAGELRVQEYALLTDRVLTNQGKPQIYGTQFDDELNMKPTRDASHLDARRHAMGLPSIAAYRCMLQVLYRK
jgi:hypothetical protein